jgi:RNA polymerase sigma-70 factor, ECF subfamily
MKNMNEEEKNGTFLALLEPFRDKLYMYARALEKNGEDAKDLVGETILTCYEYFDSIKDHSAFKGYVFKVARSKFKRKNRRLGIFEKLDERIIENLPSKDIPTDLPADIHILYDALAKLPAKQSEASMYVLPDSSLHCVSLRMT